jgi:hypothetical protein
MSGTTNDPLAAMAAAGDRLALDVAHMRRWADGQSGVWPTPLQCGRVLDLLARQSSLVLALAERCKGQSEVLGQKAEAVVLTETDYPLE